VGDPTAPDLAVEWTDQNSWRVTVPVRFGTHNLTFEAFDFRGNSLGQDTISVTSTVSDRPLEDFLRVSELMYHPDEPSLAERAAGFEEADDFEFIEFLNTSTDTTLNLAGVKLTEGVTFDFTGSGVTTLAPGQRVVVVADQGAFDARYDMSSIAVAGEYAGQLNNAGETVRLEDPNTIAIQLFTYDDTGVAWHPSTDGLGPSLVIIDPLGDTADWNDGASWRPSSTMGGTPGTSELVAGDVNGDARVDLADLAVLQLNFGAASGASRSQGDLDGDDDVDRDDVRAFLAHYGAAPVAPSPVAPSPAAPSAEVHRTGRVRTSRFRVLRADTIDRVMLDSSIEVESAQPVPQRVLRASRARTGTPTPRASDKQFSQNN
jgi:hypothetical protein